MTLSAVLRRPSTGETITMTNGQVLPLTSLADGETLLIETPSDHRVSLDGALCPRVDDGTRVLTLVDVDGPLIFGARRIEVTRNHQSAVVDLITTGGTRALARLLPAVAQVERWMPRFRGGFWYLDVDGRPRRLLDPTRVLAFARDVAPTIEQLVRDIEQRPALRHARKSRVQPWGFPIDVEGTLRLLAQRPDLVERSPVGPLRVRGDNLGPRLVACHVPAADYAAPENRRLVAFLLALSNSCRSALRTVRWLDERGAADGTAARRRIDRVLARTFLSSVPPCDLPHADEPPLGLEDAHPGYKALRRLRIEYQTDAKYGANDGLHRKHIATADRVFQAWCCYLVAAAFNLQITPGGLRAGHRAPAFVGDEWELFYDTEGVLVSWRGATSRPDNFRPDILLRRRDDHRRVILLDAKYAIDEVHEVPADRLKEVQAYMHSFGLRRAGILHPGRSQSRTPVLDRAEAGGFLLLAAAVLPAAMKDPDSLTTLRTALSTLECACGESFIPIRPLEES